LRLTLFIINPLKAELNPFCHLLALLGAHHIFHVSRIRVNLFICDVNVEQRKSKVILEVQFNSRFVHEVLKWNSDGVKFIACNFEVRHPRCVLNHSVENEYEKQS
jgi:hypothetical protein